MKLPNFVTRLIAQGGIEKRAGYGDAAIEALLSNASGKVADASATAAVESVIGLAARTLSLATVSPPRLRQAISPAFLAGAGRGLLTSGNAVYGLTIDNGRSTLTPVFDFKVFGQGVHRSQWTYELRYATPAGERTQRILAPGVLHFLINPSPSSPWQGRGPLQLAGLSSQLLGNIESKLKDDASLPTGGMITVPDGAGKEAADTAERAVREGQGKTTIVESMAQGWGQGALAAGPSIRGRDWDQLRFGPDVPDSSIALRDTTAQQVLAAFGLNSKIFNGVGEAARESYRLAIIGVITPLADVLAQELSAMFETPITLDLARAGYRDWQRISRAYAQFVNAQVDPEVIETWLDLPLVGLDDDDDERMDARKRMGGGTTRGVGAGGRRVDSDDNIRTQTLANLQRQADAAEAKWRVSENEAGREYWLMIWKNINADIVALNNRTNVNGNGRTEHAIHD